MSEETNDSFESLGLQAPIVTTLAELGYEAPTPIQALTIPPLLAGRDVIGQAQTGTGKTAAFSLPLLQQLNLGRRVTQALILTPTRELAMQVSEAMHSYSKRLAEVTVVPIYGGAPIFGQMKHLQRGAHVVVGTPGRLIDHLERGTLDLGAVRMVVLDEADEMLKMGFIDEVERMLSLVPKPRQVALFSATMPEPIARIAQRHLVNPVRIEIEHRAMSAPAIEQRFINVAEGQKIELLTQMLEMEEANAVLVFRRTKNGAAELAEKLAARGFAAEAMHGDMNQPMRESVIRRSRAGQIEIVVATDVAARGLDVEQITHVVNYDIPNDVEAYVHRIGRTGRAGRSGVATLFITPRERRMMREIERFTGTQIKPMKVPTRADVAARRITVFKESLRKEIESGDLDLYVDVVTQLAVEGPYDMADIAAAASRIANAARTLATPVETYTPAPRADEGRERSSSAAPSARRTHDRDEGKVRLAMAIGKRDGIRPGDVVGSIANEAGIPGSDIGPIDIRENVTFVSVIAQHGDLVIEKLASAKFRGRPVNIHVATDDEYERAPRAERDGPRTFRSDRGADRSGPRSYGSDAAKRPDRGGSSFPPRRPRAADDRRPFGAGAGDDRGPRRPPAAGGPRRPSGPPFGRPSRGAPDRGRPGKSSGPKRPKR